MSQQEFMDLLSGAGFGGEGGITNWGQLSDISQSDIASSVAGQYNIPETFFDEMTGMFNPFSQSALASSGIGFYSPQLQSYGASNLAELNQRLSSSPYKKTFGGFADVGATDIYQRQAKDIFQQQGAQAVTDVQGQKMTSLQALYDQFFAWQDIGSSFAEEPDYT